MLAIPVYNGKRNELFYSRARTLFPIIIINVALRVTSPSHISVDHPGSSNSGVNCPTAPSDDNFPNHVINLIHCELQLIIETRRLMMSCWFSCCSTPCRRVTFPVIYHRGLIGRPMVINYSLVTISLFYHECGIFIDVPLISTLCE